MIDSFLTGPLQELSTREKYGTDTVGQEKKELGQDVFLELMITQMQNQNPLDPQDNSEFVAQLAQFSSVEGLDKLNDNVSELVGSFQSNQALQASAMVGRSVKIDTDTSFLTDGGTVAGTIDLTQSTSDMGINIYDSSGQLVSQESLGEHAAGEIPFVWNGTDSNGEQLPAGEYRFEVLANFGGDPVQLNTALSANVDSVSVGANGVISLNLAGAGSVSISGVREIL
jgi:flagellar basal-body rod modification protein FlgD